MKNSHNKSILLRCIICGGTNFEFNDDKSWIKCKQCGKEYPEGYDELEKLNQGLINQELDKTKDEILKDAKKDITDMLKKAFKGNKNIKFKG